MLPDRSVFSYLTHLECSNCQKKFDVNAPQTYCSECQAPLLSRYDLSTAREHLRPETFRYRSRGMWRWHELLPVKNPSNIVSLGEGDTPLLRLSRLGGQLGLKNLFLKDESLNPTGCFKARGLSAAISMVKELGLKKVVIPTAGNAGGAMAAYAAKAQLDAAVVMPKSSPKANIIESQITGADVRLIDGLINHAAELVRDNYINEGWFDLSTFKEPYRLEGKKIMGYELAEYFDWDLPDVILYPTGGGTGLVGMWKAFEEIQELNWPVDNHKPRMVVVQSEGCAPIVRAFKSSKLYCDLWENAETIATGLCVPKSFADKLILQQLRDSKGLALAVSDDDILTAQRRLAATEGVFAAPEGAATLAGLIQLIDQRQIETDERIVIFNTATGLKYLN